MITMFILHAQGAPALVQPRVDEATAPSIFGSSLTESLYMTKLSSYMQRRRERRGGEKVLTHIAADGGERGKVVEWATDANGNMPARSYYLDLSDDDQVKILDLFKRLADQGRIPNREKFKKLGKKAKGAGSKLWEIKSFQHRFLGDFRPNRRFIIAHALRKKSDNLPKPDIAKAVRILQEHDQREKGSP